MIRRRSSEPRFEAFEELEPPALINPLCLRTMALFFNLLPIRGAFHLQLFGANTFPDSAAIVHGTIPAYWNVRGEGGGGGGGGTSRCAVLGN